MSPVFFARPFFSHCSSSMAWCLIALGSNLGDRAEFMRRRGGGGGAAAPHAPDGSPVRGTRRRRRADRRVKDHFSMAPFCCRLRCRRRRCGRSSSGLKRSWAACAGTVGGAIHRPRLAAVRPRNAEHAASLNCPTRGWKVAVYWRLPAEVAPWMVHPAERLDGGGCWRTWTRATAGKGMRRSRRIPWESPRRHLRLGSADSSADLGVTS